MKNDIILRPSYWASVSGGKDSLYMLYVILNNLDKYPLNGVVHFELEIDYPFIKDVIDYMESECKKYGIPFYRVKPRKSWYELVEKYGVPNRQRRWCNSQYKLDALNQMRALLKSRGEKLINYIGYCVDETYRYENRKSDKTTEVYPLVREKIEESFILNWAKNQPIFNDYYKFNKRCGCMFCPVADMRNLAYLYCYYPEKYNYFMAKCKETEEKVRQEIGKPRNIFQSNPKYDTAYIDNRVRTFYVPKLREEMKNYE